MTGIKEDKAFSEQFEVKEDLGKGAFSIVRKVVHTSSGVDYAAKIINTKRLSARDLQKLEREVKICRMLQHNNIVRLHNVFQEGHVRYMIFDLITGGELFDDIVAREFYSEKDASSCIQQILDSVSYCHKMGIIHRDIKPENLLLSSKKPGASVKLADFGLAVETEKKKHYYGFAGTPGYLSPEVLRKEPYDKAVDLWACGVVLYILLVGYPPFWDDDQSKMFEQIKQGRYEYLSPEWDSVTDEVKKLIDGMLTMDPDKRITAEQALSHPWIKNRDKVASMMHRQETIAGLKRFNARRKLKAAMHTAMIISRRSSAFIRPTGSPSTSSSNLASPPTNPENLTLIEEADTCATPTSNATLLPSNPDSNGGQYSPEEKEIIDITQLLLNSIGQKDFADYSKRCSEGMTSFEPEACSQMVTGLDFHKFYFDNMKANTPTQNNILKPKVHMLSEGVACIAYTRLTQSIDNQGTPYSQVSNETRVWKKLNDEWKCVHFHRSSQ
ncbi:PREDICTED: calcium/calmodulin-dependent protein kinase type II delta chain-like [Amphimedon queenslandica]|uniref:calcium/calmodulin-dependent protein kinase n=1 Tax=Amphimedon queenslandica TaxID=400682 RepID=A0A1X7VND2_AMPQE|nr:PREDICTED: calcium/calmodulin-dependent protein kinase type II delta chain-like [Amphimedon queenslandica]|eukprot:XP_003383392.1 PREDICTED: calcium/calmodulin-dependent protein kinase type II delta chain-like [Amphimedon queenslandica]